MVEGQGRRPGSPAEEPAAAAGAAPGPDPQSARHPGIERQCVELCPICRTADVLRATLPPEFQEHWSAWQREMLLSLRSLIDHYVEHLDTGRRSGVAVEDIPIE